jgi:hypothetical protein
MKKLSGGCSCGAVRFAVTDYLYALMCHCDACKKRTGSAYGLSVMIRNEDLSELTGETKTFVRRGESGRLVRYEFCPQCGTTVRWQIEIVPHRQVFALGAFDEPHLFEVVGEMYADEALPWARLGCELVRSGAPDDPFRNALIEKRRKLR